MKLKLLLVLIHALIFPLLTIQSTLPREVAARPGLSKDPNLVKFFLYPNPADFNDFDELILNNLNSVKNSRFDPSKRVVIYTSGFLQNRTTDQTVKNAYLKAGYADDTNIFIMDWGDLSGSKVKVSGTLAIAQLYTQVVKNVDIVGKRLADFLNFMISNHQISGPENIHLVGQSLGAHICGKAGLYFKKRAGKLIHRITGTDAARQLFQNYGKDKRLDASDAEFVVTIHTNDGGYGYSGDYGSADFYVNGGKAPQPGCDGSEDFCSHNMAVEFFAKSIVDKSLLAFDCLRCQSGAEPNIPFGEQCPEDAKGSFYIDTDPEY